MRNSFARRRSGIASVVSNDDETTSGTGQQLASVQESKMEELTTRLVSQSKTVVFVVIGLMAIVMGSLTYYYLSEEEKRDFNKHLDNVAEEILQLVDTEARTVRGTLATFSTGVAAAAVAETRFSWPNVTISDFDVRGFQSNALSGALQLTLAPLVKSQDRAAWEAFSQDHQGWIREAHGEGVQIDAIAEHMFKFTNGTEGAKVTQESVNTLHAPVWQQSPAPFDPSIVNFDLFSLPVFYKLYLEMLQVETAVVSQIMELDWLYGGAIQDADYQARSVVLKPVFPYVMSDEERDFKDVVGVLFAVLPWDKYLSNILNEGAPGMHVVLYDSCGEHFTYLIDGPIPTFLGQGDSHDPNYNDYKVFRKFAPFVDVDNQAQQVRCFYNMHVYPTKEFEDVYQTRQPIVFAMVVVCAFVVTACVFAIYDIIVSRRHRMLAASAGFTNQVIASLFPAGVRDRIIEDAKQRAYQETMPSRKSINTRSVMNDFLNNDEDGGATRTSKPIADFFPSVTTMFGDIVGFTAWSSVREPTQVFALLETVYAAFDKIATKRRVFKVETVGDCYVAVAGLPNPRPDHAVVMARFASDCLRTFNNLTQKLEVELGPDTGDLDMRIGLHSGPVTAGVLRGDRARFQLFGDTMNTTARIESAGHPNRIHLSADTAALLDKAGKAHWVKPREEKIIAKGKGEMETFWLNISNTDSEQSDAASGTAGDDSMSEVASVEVQGPDADGKIARLVDWNVDTLLRLLREIGARNEAMDKAGARRSQKVSTGQMEYDAVRGAIPVDEVAEVIALPKFNPDLSETQNPESIQLGQKAVSQARRFVQAVASLYRDNPFHNFEHASHVTMSTIKLLSRIKAPDLEDGHETTGNDMSYGITADPITQFACVFSALIHDVDHSGVSNTQLVKEKTPLCMVYRGKSLAEQNSIDLSWNLLMCDEFAEFRKCIYSNEDELKLFRQLVVNSVIATDIMDPKLKEIRDAKWDRAFAQKDMNGKATIVIEHLIQASDVSHTMQHWHVYTKWNEKLFFEMYGAFKAGRMGKDPSNFWYQGELGFFDHYVIPLANKLKACGVFGVSSDELLSYAQDNRREWERKGQQIVEGYLEKVQS